MILTEQVRAHKAVGSCPERRAPARCCTGFLVGAYPYHGSELLMAFNMCRSADTTDDAGRLLTPCLGHSAFPGATGQGPAPEEREGTARRHWVHRSAATTATYYAGSVVASCEAKGDSRRVRWFGVRIDLACLFRSHLFP